MNSRRLLAPSGRLSSAFTGFRFPPDVILLGVRWYLRFGLSYRDLEELLAERGVEVDHVTLHRWVQRFTPLLIDAARPCRHAVGRRWFVDETYVKVAGVWRYVYRAVDGYGQVIDVYVSPRRDLASARKFFTTAIAAHGEPEEVVTDKAAALANVIEELVPQALHNTQKYANNRVECDHGRLKARLRPMRGLKTDRTATVVITGHAFIQNLRRGYYELGVDARADHLSAPLPSMNWRQCCEQIDIGYDLDATPDRTTQQRIGKPVRSADRITSTLPATAAALCSWSSGSGPVRDASKCS